jgi:hypothetical protein
MGKKNSKLLECNEVANIGRFAHHAKETYQPQKSS